MTIVPADQRRKAEQLLALHRGPLLLLPNAWDALSAKVFEEVGFKAVATTSAGVAWSLGYADGENVPWHEMLSVIEHITDTAHVPVTADIEGGFSSTNADLIFRIEELISAEPELAEGRVQQGVPHLVDRELESVVSGDLHELAFLRACSSEGEIGIAVIASPG